MLHPQPVTSSCQRGDSQVVGGSAQAIPQADGVAGACPGTAVSDRACGSGHQLYGPGQMASFPVLFSFLIHKMGVTIALYP